MTRFMHWFRSPSKPRSLRVIDAMEPGENTSGAASIESAAHAVLCTSHSGITITSPGGNRRGVVTPAMLRQAVANGQGHLPLSALMTEPTLSVDAHDDLSTAASLFRRTGTHSAFVIENGRNIGILTRHSLAACTARQQAA